MPYQYFDKTSRLKRNTNAEVRVYKDDAIVGLYFKNLNEVDEAEGYLFGGEGNVAKADSEYDIKISAAYAQMRTSISNKLKMDNSVRVEFNDISYFGNSFGYSNDTLPAVESNKSYSLNGLKSSISYEIDTHSKIFAHFSYGYKSGGINQQPYVSEQNRLYNPEYLSNFELSFKTKTDKYIVIGSSATLSQEYRILNANNPDGKFKIFQERVNGLEYSISHFKDKWYITTNTRRRLSSK